IQQSAQGFSVSKSERGRTLFTVRARAAEQHLNGQASLHDVNIIIYGDRGDRYDEIYGSEFAYDPNTGNVAAEGIVHIDLQGTTDAAVRPDQAPPQETNNPIHLKTSSLIFNQKTGIAGTDKQVEFRVPHASGSAVGARYDSKSKHIQLLS